MKKVQIKNKTFGDTRKAIFENHDLCDKLKEYLNDNKVMEEISKMYK